MFLYIHNVTSAGYLKGMKFPLSLRLENFVGLETEPYF